MRALFLNAVDNYLARFGTQIISLFLIPIISSELTEAELSFYLISISFFGFSIIFFDYSSQVIAIKKVAYNIFSIRDHIISTYVIRFFFIFIVLVIFLILYFLYQSVDILIVGFIACIQGLKPIWFYQARLKLKYAIFIELIFKSLLLFYLILIDIPSLNFILFSILISETFILIIQSYPIRNILNWNKIFTNLKNIKFYLMDGINPFLSRIYGGIFISMPLPIASIWFGGEALFYLLCLDRFVRIINSFTSPFFRAMYPYFSKYKIFNKFYIYSAAISFSFFSFFLIIYFKEYFISLLFKTEYQQGFTDILFLIPPLTIISTTIAMIDYNLKGKYKQLMIYTKYACMASLVFLILSIMLDSLNMLIISILVPEILILSALIFIAFRSRYEF